MELDYNKPEMLSLWKQLRWLEGAGAPGGVQSTSGGALTFVAAQEMRRWYLGLMRDGNPDYVVAADLTSEAQVERLPGALVRVSLPEERPVMSVAEFRLQGMELPALVITDPSSPLWRIGANRFSLGGSSRPEAVLYDPSARTFTARTGLPEGEVPDLLSLRAVVDPGENRYVFLPAALETIPLF